MANKKYNDFPSGTYDTAKIFLQADAATGELTKVNLPATSGFNMQIFYVYYSSGGSFSVTLVYSSDANSISGHTVVGTGEGRITFTNNLSSVAENIAVINNNAASNTYFLDQTMPAFSNKQVGFRIKSMATGSAADLAAFFFIIVIAK